MIAALLLAVVPHDDTLLVWCDVQEVNTVYHLQCDPPTMALQQVVFRDLHEIRDWRCNRRPVYDWQRGCWRTTWIESGKVIEVRSPAMVETWTDYDTETAERELLPEAARRRVNR